MSVLETIVKILSERNDLNRAIDANTTLEDLGLDSIDIVEITVELEDKYSIEFTSKEVTGLVTVGDVVKLIEQKRK